MTHPDVPAPWEQVLARLRGRRLDDLLARRASPDEDRLLVARAAWLTSPRRRAELADAWLGTLDQARSTGVVLDTRIPVARDAVLDAEPHIIRLARVLRSRTPVAAGTVVRVRSLLADGKSALYTGQGLSRQVAELATELDPTT